MACWLYAVALFILWGTVRLSPAEFWPPHLLLYGPRWALSLPVLLLLLMPPVAWLRSRWPALALGLATVPFVGLWGYNTPWGMLLPRGEQASPTLRLLTCNVQRGDLRAGDLADLVQSARPDVVLLQEWGLDEAGAVFGQEGWSIRSVGEFYLASRLPILELETLRRPDKPYRIVAIRANVLWAGRTIPIVAVHLMTPRSGLEAIIHARFQGLAPFREVAAVQRLESGLLRAWVGEDTGSALLAGDFNLTVEHPIYRHDWSGFANAFTRTGWGLGPTMSTRRIGLRIDHVLCGRDWRPNRCWVGPEVGSAHRPVIADLAWAGPPTE